MLPSCVQRQKTAVSALTPDFTRSPVLPGWPPVQSLPLCVACMSVPGLLPEASCGHKPVRPHNALDGSPLIYGKGTRVGLTASTSFPLYLSLSLFPTCVRQTGSQTGSSYTPCGCPRLYSHCAPCPSKFLPIPHLRGPNPNSSPALVIKSPWRPLTPTAPQTLTPT